MGEEDAPKFVTPWKGTKNKKPTTFDGDNDDSSHSDPSSHYSSDSDENNADLFPLNVEENHASMSTPSDDDDDSRLSEHDRTNSMPSKEDSDGEEAQEGECESL